MTENAPVGTKKRLVIGLARNDAKTFRSLALFMARDPLYSKIPLGRLQVLDAALLRNRCLVAAINAEVVGVCTWLPMVREQAQEAIRRSRLPRRFPTSEEADAPVLITSVTGSRAGIVSRLMRAFRRMHSGRAILFERHDAKTVSENRGQLRWIDRNGRHRGPEI